MYRRQGLVVVACWFSPTRGDRVTRELDKQAVDQKKAEDDAQPAIQIVDGMVFVPGGTFLSGATKGGKETKASVAVINGTANQSFR